MTYFSLTCKSFETFLLRVGFAPAALVQRQFRVDQFAMILEQPIDAVVGAAAFFVGGERHDDVAVGLETLSLVANQVRDPDGRLRLVVAGAASVEEAVLFGELKRIHAPVFALGFDNVGVGEEQERLPAAPVP